MKRAIKITSISLLLTFLVGIFIVLGSILYTITFNRVEFSAQKIMENSLCIQVYNANNVLIKEENTASDKKLKLHMLPSYVKEAFISIEDKNFYKHNGINVKRMAKAFLNNLKSLKIKEGASTISQQLIKNTYLSSQKTFQGK